MVKWACLFRIHNWGPIENERFQRCTICGMVHFISHECRWETDRTFNIILKSGSSIGTEYHMHCTKCGERKTYARMIPGYRHYENV